jgi:hypothetical protein
LKCGLIEITGTSNILAAELRSGLCRLLRIHLKEIVFICLAGIHQGHGGIAEDNGKGVCSGGYCVVIALSDRGNDPVESGRRLGG